MEETDQEIIEDPRARLKPSGGRDELNLAEFPITLLSDRVPKDCKTIVFEVDHRISETGEVVKRKVTITGSDAYGLPTAVDDEVLLALIQLTKLKNDFTSPTVYFSSNEILNLLGWADGGRCYQRIEESIRRWTGVTLYYDNAWKDKETGTWASENFHFIERSSLVDSESRRTRRNQGQHELALSSFRWNEVIFQSFQAGSLKRLDIDAYISYTTSVAKRMYRFLDKRFWIKPVWDFDLEEFAFNRLGLSRNYKIAQIKNKLQAAIDELCLSTSERAAFLEPMHHDERYKKVAKGRWRIVLARKTFPPLPGSKPVEAEGLVGELVKRGVAREVACELVQAEGSEAEFIRMRLEVFDWVMARKDQKIIKESPTGYLVNSIRNRYLTIPKGFVGQAEWKQRVAAEEEAAKRKTEESLAAKRKDAEHRAVQQFWKALAPEQQEALLTNAGLSTKQPHAKDYTARFDWLFRRNEHIRKLLSLPPE